MQEHPQVLFQGKFMEQLFNLYGSSYIDLLNKWGMVRYLQIEEFYDYLRDRVGKECQVFIEKIRPKIDQEVRLFPHFEFHIPIIRHTEDQRQFQINKFKTFITIFSLSENKDEYFEQQVRNSKLEDEAISEQANENMKNYYHFSFEDNQKQHSIWRAKEELAINDQIMKESLENEMNQIHFKNVFSFDDSQMPQKSQSQDISKEKNKEKVQMLPSFLRSCQKGYFQLLQLDLTRQFRQQLEEVKQLFKGRLLKSKKFTSFYIDFMYDFLMVNTIRQGQCDYSFEDQKNIKKQLQRYFEKYLDQKNYQIKYCYKIKDGPLTQTWQQICKNLQPIMKRKTQNIQKKVLEILFQAIDKIFITFNGQKEIHGKTMYRTIIINVNQKNQEEKLEEYRQGTMKSYITFVLMHEITHYLVREYKGCQIKENDQSFQSSNDSIGNQILRWMKIRSLRGTRDYLAISKEKFTRQKVKKVRTTFKNIIVRLYNFIMRYEVTFTKLNQRKEQFEMIKQKVSIIYKVTNAAQQYIDITCFKTSFDSVYNYIDRLATSDEEKIQEQLQDQSDIEMTKNFYAFFFNIFRIQYVASEWRNQLGINKSAYDKYVERLDNLKPTAFFNGSNAFIDEFIENIREWDQFNEVYRQFNQLCQQNRSIIDDINSQIKIFKERVNVDDYKQLINEFSKHLQSDIQKICPLFQVKRKYQFDKIMDYCIEDITDCCTVETIYNMLMRFIKYSEENAIILQLPNVFSIWAPRFQAGYIMERQLFSRFPENIYAKDFQLFHYPEDSKKWGEIGVAPASQKQSMRHSIVYRKKDRQKDVGLVDMRKGCCLHLMIGDYIRSREAREKKQRQKLKQMKRLIKKNK